MERVVAREEKKEGEKKREEKERNFLD